MRDGPAWTQAKRHLPVANPTPLRGNLQGPGSFSVLRRELLRVLDALDAVPLGGLKPFLDEETARIQNALRESRGSITWGGARKALNLAVRDATYCPAAPASIRQLKPEGEVPLDSFVVRWAVWLLQNGVGEANGLPAEPQVTIVKQREESHGEYQAFLETVAREVGIDRPDLDVFFWRYEPQPPPWLGLSPEGLARSFAMADQWRTASLQRASAGNAHVAVELARIDLAAYARDPGTERHAAARRLEALPSNARVNDAGQVVDQFVTEVVLFRAALAEHVDLLTAKANLNPPASPAMNAFLTRHQASTTQELAARFGCAPIELAYWLEPNRNS